MWTIASTAAVIAQIPASAAAEVERNQNSEPLVLSSPDCAESGEPGEPGEEPGASLHAGGAPGARAPSVDVSMC